MPKPDDKRKRSYDGDMMDNGRKAEDAVFMFLMEIKSIDQIDDLRNVPDWQSRDVDFCVWRNGEPEFIEVKSDESIGRSPNILFEFARINHTSIDHLARFGWSLFSLADRFAIWSPITKVVFMVGATDLRDGFNRYVRDARKNTRIVPIPTDEIKTTIVFLVPCDYVTHNRYEPVGNGWKYTHFERTK